MSFTLLFSFSLYMPKSMIKFVSFRYFFSFLHENFVKMFCDFDNKKVIKKF
uniref:Uncharacterized protein n=1 Tax=Borrelia turicatae (strain 91E135) TaxID=314724 RepID=T1ECL0_BORT9|nr:hypothetical protein BTA046 [Borrelia turicatae 91E135]